LRTIGFIVNTRTIKGKTETSIRYFISSLIDHAQQLYHLIRDHWSIENLCHRYLDVDFRSEESTVRDRRAQGDDAAIKDFALSLLLKVLPGMSLKWKRLEMAFDFDVLAKTLMATI
jgi:predicted transposase YbfD/YdcC